MVCLRRAKGWVAFFHDFALVEREINRAIIAILDLKEDAGEVIVHTLDFAKKAKLLQMIALQTAPHKQHKKINRLFSSIFEQNNNRVLMAHSPFETHEQESVLFSRTVAEGSAITKQNPVWSKQKFQQASTKLKKLQVRLAELQPIFVYEVDDKGRSKAFAHYLYTPASMWVPPGD